MQVTNKPGDGLPDELARIAELKSATAEPYERAPGLSPRQARRMRERALARAGARIVERDGKRYAVIPEGPRSGVSASLRGVGSREEGKAPTKRARRRQRKGQR